MKKILILTFALLILATTSNNVTSAKTKEEVENELKQLENKVRENKNNINDYNQKIKEVEEKIALNQEQISKLSQDKIKKEQEKIKLEDDLRYLLVDSQANINGMKAVQAIISGSSNEALAKQSSIEQIDNYTKETVQKIASIQVEIQNDTDAIIDNSKQQQELTSTLINSVKGLEKDNLTNSATISSVSASNKCTLKPDLDECRPKEPEVYVTEPIYASNSSNQNNVNSNVSGSTQTQTNNNQSQIPTPNPTPTPNPNPAPANSGGWMRPAGTMTQAYGCAFWSGVMYPSGQGCSNLHNGMDFDSGFYSRIFATKDGVVVKAFDGCSDNYSACGGGWGNNVVVRHTYNGETYFSQYAHLARGSVSVSVGQSIKAGNTLGLQGNSGYSIGSHLHFSIYRGDFGVYNNSINPSSLF
jgi:murein DD-endopeptidase MepM/ murein hydrolase activator NlpD